MEKAGVRRSTMSDELMMTSAYKRKCEADDLPVADGTDGAMPDIHDAADLIYTASEGNVRRPSMSDEPSILRAAHKVSIEADLPVPDGREATMPDKHDAGDLHTPSGNVRDDNGVSIWANLPVDIMELVLQRLCIVDHLQAGAVCKNWRDVEVRALKPPMLFFSGTSLHPFPTVAYMDDKCLKKLNVSLGNGYCVGSLKGWLIMRESHSGLFLLNAFSGERILLPLMGYPVRCIMSATPTLENVYHGKCFVACLYGSKLGICRPTDKKWTFFSNLSDSSSEFYRDIAFYNGKLYAVRASHAVEVWDIDKNEPEVTILLVPPPRCKGIKTDIRFSYLVDCLNTPLMLVCSSFGWSPDFWVFKLVKQEWVEVSSIEKKILLLGPYGSEVVSAGGNNGSDIGNCIYYTTYTNRDWFHGIYSLKDRNVVRMKLNSESPPEWITWHSPDIGVQIRPIERPYSIRYQNAECEGKHFIVVWVCSRDYETYGRIFKEKQKGLPELIELDCLKLEILKGLELPVTIDFLNSSNSK